MTDSAAANDGRPAVNPFLLPVSGGAPARPLCPWEEPDDDAYYVDIDGVARAFSQFTDRVGDPADLRVDGRFIVVIGSSGSGKTSLVHRCAAWLRTTGEARSLRVAIIDLTREGAATPQSVHTRMTVICARLLDELDGQDLLTESAIVELSRRRDRPDLYYPYLAGKLPEDVRLAVLLPPTGDLADELVRYAGLVRRRMVMFAESAYLSESQVNDLIPSRNARATTIVLGIGVLGEGDVKRFTENRMRRHENTGAFPRMDENTISRVAGPQRSIGSVQRILYEVYEDRRRSGIRYTERDRITYEDITAFFFEKYHRRVGLGR
jgi:energy-coupling factor transporter ATP-binding protein EcfA2